MLDILLIITGAFCIIIIWIILYDSNRFVIKKYNIKDERISQYCKAVVLADLHNKKYGKNNEFLIHAIDEQKPDIIIVAGDILNACPGKTLDTAIELISELAKRYPIYYGNGNHEYRLKLYPDVYGDMAVKYEEGMQKAGVNRLVNEKILLPDYNIVIYGSEIDKFYYRRFKVQPMNGNYLNGLLGETDKSRYNILIAHNPDYFPHYAKWGADIVFSGHVHGGMLRVPFIGKGVVSPSVKLFPKYDGGLFSENDSKMIVSRGLGMHTIPIRLFNPGELVVVEFEPGEEDLQ